MTIATDYGFIVGKKYTVIRAEVRTLEGKTVLFDQDDGSSYPYFRIVNGDGSTESDRVCLYVTGTGDILKEVGIDEDASYSIEVSATGSTVKTSRKLTFAQVQEIVRIIGG